MRLRRREKPRKESERQSCERLEPWRANPRPVDAPCDFEQAEPLGENKKIDFVKDPGDAVVVAARHCDRDDPAQTNSKG